MSESWKNWKLEAKPKARNYCLTFFTKPKHTLPNGVRYAVYGEEICPKTGKIHWQSYIELYNSQRWNWIKKAYEDNTIHIGARKGSRTQARDYCLKDNKYEEYGKWIKGQGHRSDLETIADGLISGETTLEEVMTQAPATYCQYRNGLRDIAALGTKKKILNKGAVEPKVVVITGPTGLGKTHRAVYEHKANFLIKGKDLDWWQDYNGEDRVVIDEYDNDVSCTHFMDLIGKRYFPLRLNVKGSHSYANWDIIVITTNLKKEELHANAKPEHRRAMFRRIDEWIDLWPRDENGYYRDEELQG